MLDEHGGPHDQGRDVGRVFSGKVIYPKGDKGGMADLDGIKQYPVQSDENGKLYEQRQAAPKR